MEIKKFCVHYSRMTFSTSFVLYYSCCWQIVKKSEPFNVLICVLTSEHKRNDKENMVSCQFLNSCRLFSLPYRSFGCIAFSFFQRCICVLHSRAYTGTYFSGLKEGGDDDTNSRNKSSETLKNNKKVRHLKRLFYPKIYFPNHPSHTKYK